MYFIYLFLVVIGWLLLIKKLTRGSRVFLELLWCALFLLCGTYAYFTDDFEAYKEIIERLYTDPLGAFHLEPTWMALGLAVNGNLILFRFFCVLIGLILCYLIIRLTDLRLNYFMGYFSLMCLSVFFCWLRQPIAIFLFIIGFLLLYQRKYILAITLMILTVISHKTGAAFLLLLPMALLKISKKNLIIIAASSILLIPVLMHIMEGLNFQLTVYFLKYSESAPPSITRNNQFTN